jgi:hypothetical protein
MSKFTIASLAVLGLWATITSGRAWAQPILPYSNPYARPTVSPYLNLLRPGGTPAINYYGLVRPQFEFRATAQALQGQINQERQILNSETAAPGSDYPLPPTGHGARFMSYAGYFGNPGGLGGGGLRNPGRSAANPLTNRPGLSGPTSRPNVGGGGYGGYGGYGTGGYGGYGTGGYGGYGTGGYGGVGGLGAGPYQY